MLLHYIQPAALPVTEQASACCAPARRQWRLMGSARHHRPAAAHSSAAWPAGYHWSAALQHPGRKTSRVLKVLQAHGLAGLYSVQRCSHLELHAGTSHPCAMHTLVKHVGDEQVGADGHIAQQRQVGGALVHHCVALLGNAVCHLAVRAAMSIWRPRRADMPILQLVGIRLSQTHMAKVGQARTMTSLQEEAMYSQRSTAVTCFAPALSAISACRPALDKCMTSGSHSFETKPSSPRQV